jgi:hypothetical protein
MITRASHSMSMNWVLRIQAIIRVPGGGLSWRRLPVQVRQTARRKIQADPMKHAIALASEILCSIRGLMSSQLLTGE